MKVFFKAAFAVLSLIFLSISCVDKTKEIVILSINDMHANIDNMPIFADIVDSLRKEYPDMLVVSAGDNRTGNPFNDLYPEHPNYPMVNLMNMLGFNVSCLGNHEFDGNNDGLRDFCNEADFPIICANGDFSKLKNVGIKPYIFIENQGCKICFLGLVQISDKGIPSAHPKNFDSIAFRQPREVIKEYKFLKDKSDALVVLSHCGLDVDTVMAFDFPEADLIVGGHTHDLVEHPKTYNGVLVTQSQNKIRYTTIIKLKIKNNKVVEKTAEVININAHGGKNEAIERIVNEFKSNEHFYKVVGKAESKFNDKDALGCFMADAVRFVSNADFALQNPGGVRIDSLQAGDITIGDIYKIDPFDNKIFICKMTGRQINKFIKEASISDDHGPCHVSGLFYNIYIDENNQILDIQAFLPDGSKLKENDVYSIATNTFVASTVAVESLDEGKELEIGTVEADIDFLKYKKSVSYENAKSYKIFKVE